MKVGVVMGGISSERYVSLKSGAEVLKYLSLEKYDEIVPITIYSKKDVIEKVKDIDFAFLALHGKFGEDGVIQGALEALEIPYSGCGILSSAICMNKALTKKLAKLDGIKTANWITVKSVEKIDYEKLRALNYPLFTKPNNGGSSVATFLVKDEEEVLKAVQEGLKYDEEVIIEEYIKGDEISVTMLNREVYPTVLIRAQKGEFYNYESKYTDNGNEDVVIELEEELQKTVNDSCIKMWDILGCRSYCRIDMIIREGIPYLLEVNTLPGLTPWSIVPISAKAKGISFSELLDKIIQYSLA